MDKAGNNIPNDSNETDHSDICQMAQHWEVDGQYGDILTRQFRKRIHEKFCLSRSRVCNTVKTFN